MTNTDLANASKIIYNSQEAEAMYIGDNLVWSASIFKANYTELEYISSTSSGGQYIDLNIKLYEVLNTNYDIAIKFNIIGPGKDNTQSFLFGCQNTTSPWPGTFIRLSDNSTPYVSSRYIGSNNKDPNICGKNSIFELPVQTPPNKNVYNLSNGGQTHNFSTSLFCAFSDAQSTPNKFIEAKLYYFKLFVEGNLVRDLVPAKRKSDNVVGLYDKQNDVFYVSQGTDQFVGGPEI